MNNNYNILTNPTAADTGTTKIHYLTESTIR